MSRYEYRGETNFAKIDRIGLASLEAFKTQIYGTMFVDRTVQAWCTALRINEVSALMQFVEGKIPPDVLAKAQQNVGEEA